MMQHFRRLIAIAESELLDELGITPEDRVELNDAIGAEAWCFGTNSHTLVPLKDYLKLLTGKADPVKLSLYATQEKVFVDLEN